MKIKSKLLALVLVGTSIAPSSTGQERTSPITVGDLAPDFTLTSHLGGEITLSDALKESPVVLVFYRGYW